MGIALVYLCVVFKELLKAAPSFQTYNIAKIAWINKVLGAKTKVL